MSRNVILENIFVPDIVKKKTKEGITKYLYGEKLSTPANIYYDGYLLNVLNSLCYNVNNDWDFLIIITGDRTVRVGKSVLALQIGAYLANRIGTPFNIDNVYFDSEDLMDNSQKKPHNSVLIYDEASEGLSSINTMSKISKDIVQFFNECGQLNHVFIIVLPDYFGLNETIAVPRSECLINVYRKNQNKMMEVKKGEGKIPITLFQRGNYVFFNRKNKSILYDKAKALRQRNYFLAKSEFNGQFKDQYPIDEILYRQKKKEALTRFGKKKEERTNDKAAVWALPVIKTYLEKDIKGHTIHKLLEKEHGIKVAKKTVYNYITRIKDQMPKEKGGVSVSV